MFVEKLSSIYDELAGPPGIPWAGLTADGHGISENGYDPTYMDFMLKAGSEFFGVIGEMSPEFVSRYRNLRGDEARASISRLTLVIEQVGADVWQAVKEGDWDAFVALPRTTTMDALATVAAASTNGAFLHYDGVMEGAMRAGKMKPEEVMGHAQSVTKIFQTFVDLDKNGHLDKFKKGAPVAGLGIAPAIIGAIAAVGVMLLIATCYLFYVFQIAAPAQKKALEWCDKVAKSGTNDEIMACVNAANESAKTGNPNLGGMFGSAVAPLVAVAAVGGALYLAPYIIKSFRQLKTAKA